MRQSTVPLRCFSTRSGLLSRLSVNCPCLTVDLVAENSISNNRSRPEPTLGPAVAEADDESESRVLINRSLRKFRSHSSTAGTVGYAQRSQSALMSAMDLQMQMSAETARKKCTSPRDVYRHRSRQPLGGFDDCHHALVGTAGLLR